MSDPGPVNQIDLAAAEIFVANGTDIWSNSIARPAFNARVHKKSTFEECHMLPPALDRMLSSVQKRGTADRTAFELAVAQALMLVSTILDEVEKHGGLPIPPSQQFEKLAQGENPGVWGPPPGSCGICGRGG